MATVGVVSTSGSASAAAARSGGAMGMVAVPAPEASHAIQGAVAEALRCKAEGKAETILFGLSGHGHFDMAAYTNYLSGKLVDASYDEAELAMALSGLPSIPA